MAHKEKEIKKSCVLLFLAMVISQVTFISAINSDCKGKAFYCLNSTHFMICLDLGDGVSTTVEDFIIPCPPPTICIETNDFECEYHTTTTLKPILQSEVPVTELIAQTWRDDSDYTTFLPFWYNKEDSVRSEKYYDILDDQLSTRETLSETSTHQESTTETKINNEINIERTTFTQEEKSTLPPTFYTITEDATISSQQVKVVVNNEASDGYDNHFDTVSTTTLSESTTQTTTRYDETQPTTSYVDEYISSNNIIITKEEPPILNFYTYQDEATTYAPLNLDFWPDGITQTTNFASDKLTTTVQETKNEEIKGTSNSEISYSLTTEIEKYLNTFSDYVDTSSPITSFQEAGEMPNEVTNTNRNYEITTELNNYINNNQFDTTTPSVTLQQENRLVKDVLITNITASNSEDYIYNNSIPKIPEEDTTVNYGKTEDTAINHSNTIDAIINYINNNKFDTTTPSVTLQQENRRVKDVLMTNITDASNTDDYIYNKTIPTIPEEDITMNKSNTIDANINYINNNKLDTTTPSVTLQQGNRIVKDVLMTNISDASNTKDYIYNNSIPKIPEEDTTVNYGKTEDTAINHSNTIDAHINYINNNKFDTTTPSVTLQQGNRIVKDVLMTNISDASNTEDYIYNNSMPKISEEDTTMNYGKTEDTAINHSSTIDANINYPSTTDIHEYVNNIVSTTKENIINDEYEAKYFPKSTTTIDESSFIGIKYMTRPYVSQIFNNDVNQITYREEENTHSSGFSPKANINVILKNTQDLTTSTDVSYGDFMVNEMSSQTDKNFSEIKQTTSKVPVTGYIMQDNTSPYNPKGTIHNDEQQPLFSIENITVLKDVVSSSTKNDLKDINLESTDPLDYQISTDSSLLSPIEAPSIIKDNLIVPIFSALDNVTEINQYFKINDTIISGNNNHNMKQSNYKNQDKTNPNFYTTFTQSNALTSTSPGYDYKSNMKTTLPDLENPKTTYSELISDLKHVDTYIKETTISEQSNTDVYTFSIEDRTKTTEFTTSPWLKNAESNNNEYEITKEMNVIYHDKIPDTASTTPSIFDLNNLETVTIDDKYNIEKTVTKPSSEMKSTLSISQDGSSVNNLFTFINVMFTTSYVNATESYVPSNFQDNGITESANYMQESKPTNKTKYEDKNSSFVGNTYSMVRALNKLPDNIPDITTETIHKLSTSVPSVPIIAIINGTKTVVRYSEGSKIEGADDAIKLPAMEVNNINATKNKTVDVRHSAKTLNSSQLNSKVPVISIASNINNAAEMKSPSIALAHNISLDRHETIGNKQSVLPNIQEKKETVSVQISQPCNKTITDTTNRSNKTSPTITSEQLNLTCLNRYSGKYPDQNNCQTFYMCIGTMSPIVGRCPQNSVFSDILNQCTRNLSHCVRNNEFQCVSPGRFSDLWSRDTYYICVRHTSKFVRFKLRCQKGYILNRTSITCVEDHVIEKQSTLESYSTSSSSSSSSDSKSGQIESNTDVEFKCEKEGVFPDPNHCRKYYVCKKISKSQIRLKKKKCDSDEVFNKKKKKCVDEDSYKCET